MNNQQLTDFTLGKAQVLLGILLKQGLDSAIFQTNSAKEMCLSELYCCL